MSQCKFEREQGGYLWYCILEPHEGDAHRYEYQEPTRGDSHAHALRVEVSRVRSDVLNEVERAFEAAYDEYEFHGNTRGIVLSILARLRKGKGEK